MNKKIIIAGVIVASAFLFSGCVPDSTTSATPNPGSYATQSQQLEQTTKKLDIAVPIPQLTTSQEKLNISKRAQLFDNENKVSYIYLISYGKVMAFYTIKGKVTSLNSYMVPQDKLINGEGSPCQNHYTQRSGYTAWEPCYVVAAPDIDGSYGQNANGVFFFTTDGVYVEWSGEYMMADQPLQMSTQPELIRQIK